MVVAGSIFHGTPFTANPSSMKVVAALLRDPNPLHFDRKAVEDAGLGLHLIGQGPVSAALLYEAVLATFPRAELVSVSLRYVANVFEGDVLRGRIEVLAVDSGAHCTRARLTITITAEDGVQRVTGEAKVRWPRGIQPARRER